MTTIFYPISYFDKKEELESITDTSEIINVLKTKPCCNEIMLFENLPLDAVTLNNWDDNVIGEVFEDEFEKDKALIEMTKAIGFKDTFNTEVFILTHWAIDVNLSIEEVKSQLFV